MKIAEMNGCVIHTFPALKTMVIVEPDAIFFRCLACGETKSVHMLTNDNRSLPWMRQCMCGNAPHSGGDTQPLPEEPEPAMPLDRTLMPTAFRSRLVERQ